MATVLRQTLTDAVTDALRRRLLAGEWSAGTHLRQEILAAELGVSRIPLREAFQRLEAEGLLTLLPHRGAVAASLDPADVLEVFELRAQLEADLTRRAVPLLSQKDIQALTEHDASFEKAVVAGNLAAWGEANRLFHTTLYAPAGRPRTREIVDRLFSQVDRLVRLQLTLTDGVSRAVREHKGILAAARDRHAERTARLVRDHILAAGLGLSEVLMEHRIEEDRR